MKKDNKQKTTQKTVNPKTATKVENKETQNFSKSSIISSSKYINKRDALNTILKENEKYSLREVDEMLIKFYKTEVK